MVSIKQYLNRSEEEIILRQVISLLIERIGSRAAMADRSDFDEFQTAIHRIGESVNQEDATPETLLMMAGSAVQAMGDHNQRVSRFIRRQGGEFHSIISMLTDTVVKMGGENTRFAQRFQEIGDGMERAGGMDDLHALKIDLRECLRTFRESTLQRQAEMEGAIQALQKEVECRREVADSVPELDPVTGLPKQQAAEAALFELSKAGKRIYAVIMVVNRLQSVNARFGNQVGDQVLRSFKQGIEKQLNQGDRLFRWSGPAILALLERPEPLDRMRALVRRMLDAPIEQEFDVGGRTVLIPISAAWSAFQLIAPASIAVKQIQTFIAGQGSRDYA